MTKGDVYICRGVTRYIDTGRRDQGRLVLKEEGSNAYTYMDDDLLKFPWWEKEEPAKQPAAKAPKLSVAKTIIRKNKPKRRIVVKKK